MKKKWFGLALTVMLLMMSAFGLSACSQEKSDKIVISCTMFDAEQAGNNALWDYLEEKFNVEFEFVAVTEDNFEEKNQLMISTNEMPDLLWMDLDESNFSSYANWVHEGCFAPMPSLDELKEKYYNLYAQYTAENNYGDELMTIDGVQYAHPCIRDNSDTDFLSGMGWMYRRDWAKSLGLYQENDIYTWDEWVGLCSAFMEKDPGNNGSKNIGMGTASYYFPAAFGVYQTSSEYGFGTFTLENGEYKWTAAQDETMEGLLIAKKLWEDGLIWQDNHLGISPDSYYTSGLMGMIFQNFTVSRYNTFIETVRENLPQKDPYDICALAKVIGPDGTYWVKQSQCYYGAVVMSAEIDPEVKERWLTMLDWFVSAEGSRFIRYGIEGIDYRMNGDEVECLWPASETDSSALTDPYPSGSRLFFECYVGAPDPVVAPAVNYAHQAIDTVNSQYKFMMENAYIRRFDYESSYLSFEAKDNHATLQADMESKMMELIVNCRYEDLKTEWTTWVNEQMSYISEILDGLNDLVENKPREHEIKLAG